MGSASETKRRVAARFCHISYLSLISAVKVLSPQDLNTDGNALPDFWEALPWETPVEFWGQMQLGYLHRGLLA